MYLYKDSFGCTTTATDSDLHFYLCLFVFSISSPPPKIGCPPEAAPDFFPLGNFSCHCGFKLLWRDQSVLSWIVQSVSRRHWLISLQLYKENLIDLI